MEDRSLIEKGKNKGISLPWSEIGAEIDKRELKLYSHVILFKKKKNSKEGTTSLLAEDL